MSTTWAIVAVRPGRSGEETSQGLSSLSRVYRLVAENNFSSSNPKESELDILAVDGLPKIGDAHSTQHPNLRVISRKWQEGTGTEKRVVDVTVTYGLSDPAEWLASSNSAPPGQDIESCGWKSGSTSRDAICDVVTGKTILSSAGQPFESVPQIDVPSSTWCKVVKKTERQTDWLAYLGKINDAAITLGGRTIEKHCARVIQVDEEELYNNAYGYKYRYTIGIQQTTNIVTIDETETELGWDLAIVDQGTLELDNNGAQIKITAINPDTGVEEPVAAPVLLDGRGHRLVAETPAPPTPQGNQSGNSRSSESQSGSGESGGESENPSQVYLVYQIYPEDSFDSDFITETPTERDQEEENNQ